MRKLSMEMLCSWVKNCISTELINIWIRDMVNNQVFGEEIEMWPMKNWEVITKNHYNGLWKLHMGKDWTKKFVKIKNGDEHYI